MNSYRYFIVCCNVNQCPYSLREILNIFKYKVSVSSLDLIPFQWNNYLGVGKMEEDYWEEAKNKGYI